LLPNRKSAEQCQGKEEAPGKKKISPSKGGEMEADEKRETSPKAVKPKNNSEGGKLGKSKSVFAPFPIASQTREKGKEEGEATISVGRKKKRYR